MIEIRPAVASDADNWRRLRSALWPGSDDEHAKEIDLFFAGKSSNPGQVLLAVIDSSAAVGFVELSIRRNAESCYSGRVAYLEGWYVEPARRKQGVGRALIEAAEDWGREMNCTEMASDSDLDNDAGQSAHRATGFDEVGRAVLYRKGL